MFGYVTIFEPELKMKDYRRYKAYYCGLCQALKEQYGSMGQLTLSYDMTFVVILLTSLYESDTAILKHRCKVHPMKQQTMLYNDITKYCADMNLLLCYFHMEDDWKDEKKIKGLAGMLALKRRVKKIIQRYPRQSEHIRSELKALAELETAGDTTIDQPANCFGRLMAEILVYQEDMWADRLQKIGYFLGKYIYIMDAYDDLEEDQKKNCYNPLTELAKNENYEEKVQQILCMMIAECTAYFEQLPCILDVDILRNILYDGVWNRYRKKKEQLEKKEESHYDKKSL
ncbi:MAG: DUF5685 family protein [Lachnospiraceae bacterium]|jgi:hypothetical protein